MADHMQTFFWYDLETTGISPRSGRIMQFAGQRTDMDLQPIGEPVNLLIRLSEDVLPEPEAILITGITPQMTISDGLTEAEFLKIFYDEVVTPGTIFAGYNTVRFDDEFMRYLNYRNFYDAYEWEWKDGRSRWDLLDVVRMTRALRPEGIRWPVTEEGRPTNRLELITKLNGLAHEHAHDALNDVLASIAVAKLIKTKQPKLFSWLLDVRDKKRVAELIEKPEPFVYTSGKFSNETEKTTAVVRIAKHPTRQGALVYDLRHDPTAFLGLSPQGLADRWHYTREDTAPMRLPVKTLQYNRCPAVAPLGVMQGAPVNVQVDVTAIKKHLQLLRDNPDFIKNVLAAQQILDDEQDKKRGLELGDVDTQLYDGFFEGQDKMRLERVRSADIDELSKIADSFQDIRLQKLAPLYKARNYPKKLSIDERTAWEAYRFEKLMQDGQSSQLALFMRRIDELKKTNTNADKQYLLEELQLYAESIVPLAEDNAI